MADEAPRQKDPMKTAPFGRLKNEGAEVNSFRDGGTYLRALFETPRRLKARMGATWTQEAELAAVHNLEGGQMKRDLHWFDLFCFGVGSVVGGGIFISSGEVARDYAGPAVILSFLIAGVAALFSAMCFAEFAVEIPTAGGAYSYIRIAFGEFISFLAGFAILGGALTGPPAVARAFTSYLCTVFGNTDTNAWRIYVEWLPSDMNYIDLPAVALLLVLTLLSCWSTKESSTFNIITTVIHIAFILFIIVAGFAYGNESNLYEASSSAYESGFFPYGLTGVFTGASVAYFSYIGFDCVATLAEECHNPGFTLPAGIVGSLVFSGIIFCSMVSSLVYLQPYNLINVDAPYSVAFSSAGVKYATQIVGIGAVLGTVTATFASIIAIGRYLTAMGRAAVIPQWFAKVNSTTGTPVNAQLSAFSIMAIVGIFVDSTVLININTALVLFAYTLVAAALILYRFHKPGENSPVPTFIYLIVFVLTSVAFVFVYHLSLENYGALIALGCLCLVETFAFSVMYGSQMHSPQRWGVPCMPYFGAASMFICIFLVGSFGDSTEGDPLVAFGCIMAFATLIYVLYSVHASWDSQYRMESPSEIEVVEK